MLSQTVLHSCCTKTYCYARTAKHFNSYAPRPQPKYVVAMLFVGRFTIVCIQAWHITQFGFTCNSTICVTTP